jgi:hypothetical protein
MDLDCSNLYCILVNNSVCTNMHNVYRYQSESELESELELASLVGSCICNSIAALILATLRFRNSSRLAILQQDKYKMSM